MSYLPFRQGHTCAMGPVPFPVPSFIKIMEQYPSGLRGQPRKLIDGMTVRGSESHLFLHGPVSQWSWCHADQRERLATQRDPKSIIYVGVVQW